MSMQGVESAQMKAKTGRRRSMKSSGRRAIPYASASSGAGARDEAVKILRQLGCESVGFMDDFAKHEVLLAFTYRGQQFERRVSAKGWAQLWLKQNPWSERRRDTRQEWEQKALRQGQIAVNSMLRDWMKGLMTQIECGIMSFEAVFMPYMLTNDGRPLIERLSETNMLPEPTQPKVVSIQGPR
jgi:hypothetical protein